MSATIIDETPSYEELQQEYRVLQEFLHLAPVGLLRADNEGRISVMNPMASQLLSPLGLGGGDINLFNLLERVSSDVRLLVQTFDDSVGVICENYRLLMPSAGAGVEAPLALGLTVMRVSAAQDPLLVVITDQTSAVKLQRLQGSWIR